MKFVYWAVVVAVLGAHPAIADGTADHYEGAPAETLAQAVTNLSEYNGRMARILAQDNMSGADMEEIHQLTYTLEVALAKLNAEAAALADTLERVHLASEGNDVAALRSVATAYLDTARQIVP